MANQNQEPVVKAGTVLNMSGHEMLVKAIRANDEKVISTKAKLCADDSYIVNGQTLHLQINRIPLLNNNGSIIGIGCIGNHITSHKQQSEEIEIARNKILSIIAHDLKNPFNSILGIADLLKTNLSEFSFAEIHELISSLDSSSKKAVDLFDNLLAWTKSSWREENLQREIVNLNSLVYKIIMPLKLTAKDKNITIHNNVAEYINISIDINTISAVIRNLVNNSIKFTNIDGEIIIDSILQDDIIEIIISDNGIGMSDEKIESLFMPELNESSIGTFNEMGIGLGLIVCKDFVQKNGGEIWAEKNKNGSEFHFTVPLSKSL